MVTPNRKSINSLPHILQHRPQPTHEEHSPFCKTLRSCKKTLNQKKYLLGNFWTHYSCGIPDKFHDLCAIGRSTSFHLYDVKIITWTLSNPISLYDFIQYLLCLHFLYLMLHILKLIFMLICFLFVSMLFALLKHRGGITWPAWRLISLVTRLSVQQFVQANNQKH